MKTQAIAVDLSTYSGFEDEYGDEYDMGGYVKIICGCGFSGYVDVDDDGFSLMGGCDECGEQFEVKH